MRGRDRRPMRRCRLRTGGPRRGTSPNGVAQWNVVDQSDVQNSGYCSKVLLHLAVILSRGGVCVVAVRVKRQREREYVVRIEAGIDRGEAKEALPKQAAPYSDHEYHAHF